MKATNGAPRRALRTLLCVALTAGLIPAMAGTAVAAGPVTYWVDVANGDDAHPGTESEPFKTITYAGQIADSDDTIMVEPGTYSAASGEVFPIALAGESLVSTEGRDSTVLQGDEAHPVLRAEALTENDRISGLRFTRGGVEYGAGLGVHLNTPTGSGSVYIEDNIFEDNHTIYNGGGLNLFSSGSEAANAVVRNNIFRYNSCGSSFGGGGLYALWLTRLEISGNEFVENSGHWGGGIAIANTRGPVEIRNNRCSGNEAAAHGGGIGLYSTSTEGSCVLEDNEISANVASEWLGWGGGLYVDNFDVQMSRTDGSNNAAQYGGFGYLTNGSVDATNNVIFGGSSEVQGAAWYLTGGSQLTEQHDTVAENGGAGFIAYATPDSTLSIGNSIYWNSWLGTEISGADAISHTCVEPNAAAPPIMDSVLGDGMIYDDPLFVDAEHRDVRLSLGSPCIDTANPTAAPATDYFGTARPFDGDFDGAAAPDMGYHEYSDSTPPAVSAAAPLYSPGLTKVTINASDPGGSGVKQIEYKLDGVAKPTVPGSSAIVSLTKLGSNTVQYRAMDNAGNYSDWQSLTVTVKSSTTLSLSAPSVSAYRSARLAGRLYDAAGKTVGNRPVLLEYSSDGVTWKPLATVYTSKKDAKGWLYEYTAKPSKKTYYRARFAGDGSYLADSAPTRVVLPKVYLTRPSFGRSTLEYGETYKARGYLKPRHKEGTYPVKIAVYRYSNGKYRYVKTYSAKAFDYSSYTKYVKSIKLPSRGKWRLRAVHPADSLNAKTYSSWRYVTVN